MPLVRFEVKNEFGFGNPELYRSAASEDSMAVLDGVAVAGLVGILRQLGDLTEFASDIFHDLHEQVTVTSTRGCKMFTRIKHIEAALPSLEQTIHSQRSHIHFAYVEGSGRQADLRSQQSHLLSTDLPRFMMDSYEECQDPPRLYQLDKFDTGDSGACLKRYSDPSYFKRVWAVSELRKVEMEKKEMNAKKIKKKRSRLKKEEVQRAVPSSSYGSRFPSIDEQFFSTETASISDIRFKPELASRSTLFGSRTRLNFVEQVPDTNSSVLSDVLEYDSMAVSKLQINQKSPTSDVPNRIRADDNFIHGPLQDQSLHRSPSVTWDEKTEIVTPASPKPCDGTLAACTQNTGPLKEGSEQSDMEHETTKFGTLHEDKNDIARMPMPLFSGSHLDEPASETDNYMDALNTLESETETETDSECQNKGELRSKCNFNHQKVESDTAKLHEMAARNSEFSGTKTSSASQKSLNRDEFPRVSNLVPTDSLENVLPPWTTGFAPDLVYSASNKFSENNVLSTSRSSGFEGISSDQLPESSLCNPCIPLPVPSNMTATNTSEFWTNGTLLGLEPSKPPVSRILHSESKANTSGFDNSKCYHSNPMGTTKLHYSGMATKSEPEAMSNETFPLNSSSPEVVDGSPCTSSYFSCRDLSGRKLFERTNNALQQINPPRVSQSLHDNKHDSMPVKQNSQRYLQALSLSECQNIQGTLPKNVNAQVNESDLTVANGAELSGSNNAMSQANGFGPNTKSISSHLSAIAQTFIANGAQRRASLAQADISKPSEVVNVSILQNNPLQNHGEGKNVIASQTSYEQNTSRKVAHGSSMDSISSFSHYSGHSSPPLECMKISFHPMNVLDTSKLELEFPNGTLHKGYEDLMFPSFQLLPGSIPPSQVGCLESDDDTFCISCPDTSEDYLSPRSDSNSDLWGKSDKIGSKNFELYNDLHRISLSSGCIPSFKGTDQISQILPAIEFENLEAESGSGILYFESGDYADLPGFDSFISSKGQDKLVSLPTGSEGFELQSPSEQPPPPPLPPMQWRMARTSFAKEVDRDSRIAQHFKNSNIEHAKKFTSDNEQEKPISRPPQLPETMAHTDKRMRGRQKLNGHGEPNHDANGKEVGKAQALTHPIQDKHDREKLNGNQEPNVSGSNGDEGGEREDLLYQIQNKTFNLRRTTTAKPMFAPPATTNINVAAILEKANAIRQAFVGSDDENDDSNWSDG